MERKAGINKVKLHSYLLLPDAQEQYNLIREDPFVQVNIRGGKETRFTFDDCFYSNGNNVPECLTNKLSVSAQMALIGYASTLLIYSPPITTEATTTSADSFEAEIISGLTQTFFNIEKLKSIAGDCRDSVNNTCSIEACCYELIDNQIRDLTSSSSPISTPIGLGGSEMRLRDGSGEGQFFMDGVLQASYTDHTSLLNMIHTSLTRRSIAIGTISEDSSLVNDNNEANTVVLGAIGTVFFQFRVITNTSFTINNHTHTLKKQAVMTVVSLATNDALVASMEFKGQLNMFGSSLPNQLRNSMKAIATLSRVINSLVERSSSDESIKKVHVPFRDSMLTRLLRSSLEGNTFLSMITRPSKDLESAARALRFASQISCLHNVIWIKEELIMTRLLLQLRQSQQQAVADNSPPTPGMQLSAAEDNKQDTEEENKFQSAIDAMKQEMFSLQVDLDRLEANREAALKQLAIAMQTVPNSNSGSSNSGSNSQGGFKLQELIIEEEDRLRADFKKQQLQQAALAAKAAAEAEAERLQLEKAEEQELMSIVQRTGSRSRSSSPRSKLRSLSSSKSEMKDDSVMSSNDDFLLPSPQRQRQLKPIVHRSSSSLSASKDQLAANSNNNVTISTNNRIGSLAIGANTNTTNSSNMSIMSSKRSSSFQSSKPLLGPLNMNQSQSSKLQNSSSLVDSNSRGSISSDGNISSKAGAIGMLKSNSSRVPTNGAASSSSVYSSSYSSSNSSKNRLVRRQEIADSKNNNSGERSRTAATGTRPLMKAASRPNIAALAAAELKEQEQLSPAAKLSPSLEGGVEATNVLTESLAKSTQQSSFHQSNEQAQDRQESSATTPAASVAAVKPFDISRLLNTAQSTKEKEREQRRLDREQDSAVVSSNSSSKLPGIAQSPAVSPFKSSLLKNKSNSANNNDGQESGRQHSDDHDDQTSREEEQSSADNSTETQAISTSTDAEQPQGSLRRIIRREMWGAADNDWTADDDLSDLERKFLRSVATGNMANTLRCLQEGVDIHVKNTFERDAMQIAARWGSVEMLELLENHGGSISSRGPKGDSLFHLAAYNGHIDTMRWLQSKGIFTEGLDIFGQNVVHIAARRGEISVLKYLQDEIRIELFTQEDFDGRIPQDCIPRRGPTELQQCREFFANLGVDEEENLNLVFARIRGVDW